MPVDTRPDAPADAACFEARVQAALDEVRARAARFRAAGDAPAARVLCDFDRLLQPLNGLEGRVSLFVHVHPSADLRERCEGLERSIAALRTELALDRGLFDALSALDPHGLDPQERRLLARSLRDFRRSGVDRDEPVRAEIRRLQDELVALGQEFDRNIVSGGREFVLREGPAGLAGLPADFVAAHPPRADGTVVLSTDPHDRLPFMTYAERADLRREYYLAATNRAVPENLDVLPRLLERRHALARRLGYRHWADYATEDKMAGSAAAAREFLERLAGLVSERALAERQECLARKRAADPTAELVHEWERAYLVEKIRAERFGLDSRTLRAYFPCERVQAGVLATAEQLFGLEFRREHGRALWHESAECWEIRAAGSAGELLGRFYLDLYPREGKYKHAAMIPLTDGLLGGELPEAALVCNFPRPAGSGPEHAPALLQHSQVTTFFHEFGHLLHHVLAGRQRFLGFSGIATERDFVEVPSQLFEEWAWDALVLARFARHADTGEPIPPELVRRLRAAEEHGKALAVQQQVFLALLSLGFYDRDPAGLDPTATMVALKRETTSLPHTDGSHFHASFGHLNAYSALYYTYLWSQVIAKDLAARFAADPLDSATAGEYRRKVLEPGGARDARELVRDFLGRDYSCQAFERWLGE